MSYCRFSSDTFRCDIYAYLGWSGYTIHVAANRIVGDVPPLLLDADPKEFMRAYERQRAFLTTARHEDITLPHAGETFVEDTLEDFERRLLYLREIGYRFPDHVLDEIRDEMREDNAQSLEG